MHILSSHRYMNNMMNCCFKIWGIQRHTWKESTLHDWVRLAVWSIRSEALISTSSARQINVERQLKQCTLRNAPSFGPCKLFLWWPTQIFVINSVHVCKSHYSSQIKSEEIKYTELLSLRNASCCVYRTIVLPVFVGTKPDHFPQSEDDNR
jgi:hypothetical protein